MSAITPERYNDCILMKVTFLKHFTLEGVGQYSLRSNLSFFFFTNEFFLLVWESPCHRLWFPNKLYFSLKIVFVLANSVFPGEMLHDAAFHLGLHCLQKPAFRSHQYTRS